ncbi:MAG: prenyltransferase/squalene oxidase repeat-containing protein [Verrucomicrobiales bacterium]
MNRRGFNRTLLGALGCPLAANLPAQIVRDVFERFRKEVEASVSRAFDYLVSQEDQSEGTFPDGAYGRSTGISSLVGMALLSTGQRPGVGKYGEAINRRVDFALRHAKDNGLIESGDHGHGPMYAHNISTLFLSECSGMLDPERQTRLDKALGGGVKVILDAQAVRKDGNQQGGWRYFPNSTDSDLSCSGWALMSLRSAKLNGAPVPQQAIDSAVAYIYRRQNERLGHFGYQGDSDHADTLTGAAILSLCLCGRFDDPQVKKAADWILTNFKKLPGNQFEFYGNYYNAQAMFQMGGKYWETYASWMYDHYVPQQKKDGSWEGTSYGRIYSTAMMVLAFTVPYRQLPIYQRDERVDEEK